MPILFAAIFEFTFAITNKHNYYYPTSCLTMSFLQEHLAHFIIPVVIKCHYTLMTLKGNNNNQRLVVFAAPLHPLPYIPPTPINNRCQPTLPLLASISP